MFDTAIEEADLGGGPSLTGDDRCSRLVELQRERAAICAEEARLLASVEADGTCEADFGLSTAQWLAREAHLPPAVTRRRVRVAVGLGQVLPATLDAMDDPDGLVGWEHARVLADLANPRVRDRFAEIEAHLLGLIPGSTFETWRREVTALVDLADADGGHHPDPDGSRLSVSRTLGGVEVSGRLVGDLAECVRHAIEAHADELFHRYRADRDLDPTAAVPSRARLRAEALAELCRRGRSTDPSSSRPPRAEVTLTVPADDPGAGASGDGVRLADGTTRLQCCDADWFALVVDSLGVPLDAGSRTRRATPTQRRALDQRDGGCVFPGCDHPPTWCDAHHIVPVDDGGPTDLANLALVCRHHHRVVHRTGWQLSLDEHQRPVVTTPDGRRRPGQHHGRIVQLD